MVQSLLLESREATMNKETTKTDFLRLWHEVCRVSPEMRDDEDDREMTFIVSEDGKSVRFAIVANKVVYRYVISADMIPSATEQFLSLPDGRPNEPQVRLEPISHLLKYDAGPTFSP